MANTSAAKTNNKKAYAPYESRTILKDRIFEANKKDPIIKTFKLVLEKLKTMTKNEYELVPISTDTSDMYMFKPVNAKNYPITIEVTLECVVEEKITRFTTSSKIIMDPATFNPIQIKELKKFINEISGNLDTNTTKIFYDALLPIQSGKVEGATRFEKMDFNIIRSQNYNL